MRRILVVLLVGAVGAGCAATRPDVPYPAFVQADELPDVFLAALPGVRAKQFAGNPQSGRTSNRIVLPDNWSGTTGASPGKALELYVLFGELKLGDLSLGQGGYAWFPAGFAGVNISTTYGAEVLYFLDDADPATVIRTPLIYSSESAGWQPLSQQPEHAGLAIKDMRRDPGSGARTWLLRVAPEASVPWQSRARVLEGYLLSGRYRATECVAGKPVNGTYGEGGYFHRPGGAVHGGPKERALETSVWLLRSRGGAEPQIVADCGKAR